MANKDRLLRRTDVRTKRVGGADIISGANGSPAAPSRPVPRAPTNLAITTTVLTRSAVTPKALAKIRWRAPVGLSVEPDGYVAQWSTSAAFTSPTTVPIGRSQTTADIEGLPTGTTVYIRLAAMYRFEQSPWSNTASALTVSDTVPPDPPPLLSVSPLVDGTFRVSWQKPASPNFRAVELRIFNAASKAVEYEVIEEADGTVFDWTAARNREQTVGSPDGSPDTAIYVEARALSWGGVYSTAVGASATSPRPGNVTGATATWDGATGICRFRWNAVAGATRYDLTIDGVTRPVTDLEYVYTLAQNRQEHSGTADPSLTWSVVAVNALDQLSLTPAGGTATLAPPPTPTNVVHPWSGETANAGVADADWSITCDTVGGVVGRRLTIDTVSRDLPISGRYGYPLALNAQEHGGTPDPLLSWSLVWVDALGQTSAVPASGTATNANPATVSITLSPGFSTLGITLGQSPARDLSHYRVRVYKDLALVATIAPDTSIAVYEVVDGEGSYTADVTVFDLFGQASSITTSAAVELNPLTLDQLRAGIRYRDDLGTAATTLKAALADNNTASGGISYNAGAWNKTTAIRELLDRYMNTTIASTGGQGYLGVSETGEAGSYTWYSGPLAADGRTLTAVASETAAQAAAVALPANGRWQLPSPRDARYVALGHRSTGAYTLREFYPRRLIEADDIRAEAITALHIAAAAITSDKLFATDLGAIRASLGQVTINASGYLRSGQSDYNTGTGFWLGHSGGVPKLSIGSAGGQGLTWDGSALSVSGSFNLSGVATIGASGGLYQGTGTFASPTTGLKIWNASGIGRLATYSGGTVQVELDSSGRLVWGGGSFRADSVGIRRLVAGSSPPATAPAYAFHRADTEAYFGGVTGAWSSSGPTYITRLEATSPSGTGTARVELAGTNIHLLAADNRIAGNAWISAGNGLDVGMSSSAFGGAAGQIRAAGLIRSATRLEVENSDSLDFLLARLGRLGATGGTRLDITRTGLISGNIELQALRTGVAGGAKITLGSNTGDPVTISTGLDIGSATLGLAGGVASRGSEAGYYFYDRSASNFWAWYGSGGLAYFFTSNGSANLIQINQSGEMGLGEAPVSNQRLRVRGRTTGTSGYGIAVQDSAGTNNFYIRDDGAGFLRAGAWTHSDLFAKTNFGRLDAGLAELEQLSAWRYDYKHGPERQIGLIAQQVRRVLPELVDELPDGMGLGLNYTGLIPVLINAVKELSGRVRALEAGTRP